MDYILSVDLGTTALKIALFDRDGNTMSLSTQEYQLLTPTTLSVELGVETYWNAFKEGIREVLTKAAIPPKDIRTLGLSAQGETLIVIGRDGKPLRNAIVWLDNRAQEEADILAREFGHEACYKRTGQVKFVPTWPASKILWIKRNEPEVFERTYKYLLIEDYFIYRLTGQFVAEGSLLCSTTYWDIISKQWWPEMLEFLSISPDQLPQIRESGEVVGTIIPGVALELGLSPDTIVATGALDQAAGAIGVGNIKSGIFSENTGAALAICMTVDKPTFDPLGRMPCHYHGIPDTYMMHTFTTGGMVLRWFRDNFCQPEMIVASSSNRDAYDLIGLEVNHVPAGCDGLIMLPHLAGAMAPESNPKAKGVFYGFTLHHTREHFARAIMEAIACIVKRNIDVIEELGNSVFEVRCLGGGSKSRIWNQIKADLTQRTVLTAKSSEAACLGAAILAGKAVGMYRNLEEACSNMITLGERFEPNVENAEVYSRVYKQYVRIYDSLINIFAGE
ncbi:MAG: FGGY-family carbohydrate kinase [Firmicutes bacterium]|nr:FGGY-family carbohydrate kinase [Bacillota bacterium]